MIKKIKKIYDGNDEKSITVLFFLLTFLVIIGIMFGMKSYFYAKRMGPFAPNANLGQTVPVPTIEVPCIPQPGVACPPMYQGGPVAMNIAVPAQDFSSSIIANAVWPRTYYVITESIVSKKEDGTDGKVFKYGEKIVIGKNREVLEDKVPTGNFIKDDTGLMMSIFYTGYSRVFPVVVSAYKKIPLEIRYKILEKSGAFCSPAIYPDIATTTSILAGNASTTNTIYFDVANMNNCGLNFSMPRSAYIAEHSIAYANLDDDTKTPNHVLVVMENAQYQNGGNCSGSGVIFSIDADGKYYVRDLSVMPICYVESLKKGTTVNITKITNSANGMDPAKEAKEDFVMPADSFVLHHENNEITYLLYDKTTSTQVKVFPSKQYIYPGGVSY